jgi:hypothetical protein
MRAIGLRAAVFSLFWALILTSGCTHREGLGVADPTP